MGSWFVFFDFFSGFRLVLTDLDKRQHFVAEQKSHGLLDSKNDWNLEAPFFVFGKLYSLDFAMGREKNNKRCLPVVLRLFLVLVVIKAGGWVELGWGSPAQPYSKKPHPTYVSSSGFLVRWHKNVASGNTVYMCAIGTIGSLYSSWSWSHVPFLRFWKDSTFCFGISNVLPSLSTQHVGVEGKSNAETSTVIIGLLSCLYADNSRRREEANQNERIRHNRGIILHT